MNEKWRIIGLVVALALIIVSNCIDPIMYLINKNNYNKIECIIVDEYKYGHRSFRYYAVVEIHINDKVIKESMDKNFWEHKGDRVVVMVSDEGKVVRPFGVVQLQDVILIIIVLIAIRYYIKGNYYW